MQHYYSPSESSGIRTKTSCHDGHDSTTSALYLGRDAITNEGDVETRIGVTRNRISLHKPIRHNFLRIQAIADPDSISLGHRNILVESSEFS
jgi:hypothetical protein